MRNAAILLAHGSRDAHWLAPFQRLTDSIQQQLSCERIELAFMELAEPSLNTQIFKLAAEGFQHLDIIPLFFAEGRHLRKDVPQQLQQFREQLIQKDLHVSLTLHSPVGLEAEVIQGIQQVVGKKLKKTHT